MGTVLGYLRPYGRRVACGVTIKFAAAVLPAIQTGELPADEFAMVAKLSEVTGVPVPKPLAGLKELPVLHTGCVTKEKMNLFIRDFLG